MEAEAGVTAGSGVSPPLPDPPPDLPPLYLDPGLWARLTPSWRHAVLFSLQRTGWGGRAVAVADLPHPGWTHFITEKAWPGPVAAAARGKLCFANTRPPGSSPHILCKHPGLSSPGQQRGHGCWVPSNRQGSSWARCRLGVLAEAALGRACPGCPPASQWPQCLEMNTGVTVPGSSQIFSHLSLS